MKPVASDSEPADAAADDADGEVVASGYRDPWQVVKDARAAKRSPRTFAGSLVRAVHLVLRSSRLAATISIVFGLVSAAISAAQVLFAKFALDALLRQDRAGGSLRPVAAPVAALLGIGFVTVILGLVQSQVSRLLGERVQRQALVDVLDVASNAELESFDDPTFFDRLQRVLTNASVRPIQVTSGLVSLISGFVGTVALGAAVWTIAPILVPILLLASGPTLVLARMRGKREFEFAVAQTPRLRERDYVQRLLTQRETAKEVRAFDLGDPLGHRWRHRYDDYLADLRTHLVRLGAIGGASALVVALSTGGTTALLIWLVASDRISLGAAGAAIVAIRMLADRVGSLVASVSTLFEASLFLEEVEAFAALREQERPIVRAERAPFEQLVVDNVSYVYPGSNRRALTGVDLRIERGEVIALVGENGSGKTTLAKVLAGLLMPTEGQIAWDGATLNAEDLAAVRSQVAVLFQDFAKYELSAHDNIGFGRVENLNDRAAVIDAAKRSGADDFLSRLPRAYDTRLSRQFEGGRDLSVGQWQRVALARAYLRDAPFLILDEPSAALDPRAERALLDEICRAQAGRTVLLITHRLASTRDADRIYVLHKGEVVECGRHDELMANNGSYAEMYRIQAASYTDA
jgi:ATP-binding cassette subfamily B protein